jgi:hypothetical protein
MTGLTELFTGLGIIGGITGIIVTMGLLLARRERPLFVRTKTAWKDALQQAGKQRDKTSRINRAFSR